MRIPSSTDVYAESRVGGRDLAEKDRVLVFSW